MEVAKENNGKDCRKYLTVRAPQSPTITAKIMMETATKIDVGLTTRITSDRMNRKNIARGQARVRERVGMSKNRSVAATEAKKDDPRTGMT